MSSALEVFRQDLIDRARRSDARVVMVTAPAGYGKSTFVRQLTSSGDSNVVCDLAGVRDALDLFQRVVAALARARPDRAEMLALAQVSLGHDVALWSSFVRDAWFEDGEPDVIIFENSESLKSVSGALTLLRDELRGEARMTIVCSRVALDIPYGRGLSPADVLLVRQDDLRFSRKETDAALPDLLPDVRTEVERISRGWPVVVSLIGRLARFGAWPQSMAALDSVVHDELYEYLASELIAALPPKMLPVVLALAGIPGATPRDVERAVGRDAADDIHRAQRDLPMSVSPDSATMDLHPMVAQMLLRKYPRRCDSLVREAARKAAAVGDDVRAASLYLRIGDKRAAAATIKNAGAYMMSTPSPALAAVLSALDEATLMEFPALWCAAIFHRGYSMPPYDWLRHARHMWDHLPPDAPTPLRDTVLSALVNGYANIGLCREASELLDDFAAATPLTDPGTRILVLFWRSVLEAYDGRYERIGWYTKEIMPMLEASAVTHALYLYDVVSPMLQARGEWERVEETMARSRGLAANSMLAAAMLPTVESVYVAWWRHDDAAFEHHLAALEALLRQLPWTVGGHRFFIACARGRARGVPFGFEKAKTRSQALLIASASSKTLADAVAFAHSAVQVADDSSRRLFRVLARVALAELVPDDRTRLLHEAASIAEELDSEPMREALARLRQPSRDPGMLAPFVDRFRAFGSAVSIEIHLLAGVAAVNGKTTGLAPAEYAIVAELAQERRWFDAAEIQEDIFPELDSETAANRLYVTIHRLRKRLHRDVVAASRSGYRIGSAVVVDLWEAEAIIKEHAALGGRMTLDHASRVKALLPMVRAELAALAARARLPNGLELRLTEARRLLLAAAASSALDAGDVNQSLLFCEALLADDPCDEDGHACRIRSLLVQSGPVAAEAAWQAYRNALVTAVNAEPPPFSSFIPDDPNSAVRASR